MRLRIGGVGKSGLGGAAVVGVGAGLALLWGLGLPLGVLGGALYLAAATLSPRAGVAGIVAALPLYPMPLQLGGLALSLPEVALPLCFAAVGLRTLAARRRFPSGPGTPRSAQPNAFDAPIALFLVAAVLSLLVTEYLRLSLRELRTLIVEPVLFFYLARHVVRTIADAMAVLDGLLLAGTAVALLAIGQFFLGGVVTEVDGLRRVQGTYTSPNHLGLLLGRVVPYLVAVAWLLPSRRPASLAATMVCTVALGMTFSVGAWAGTAAAILALALVVGGRRVAIWALGAAVVAALVALPVLGVGRVLGRLDLGSGTAAVRLQLWQAALRLLAEQPLLGIGLDNFLYRYASYLPPGVVTEPNLSHPHNIILQFWLQLGLMGLVALLWLLGAWVRSVAPWTRPGTPVRERAIVAGALASMTDFVVHGLVDNSYFLVDTAFIFWLTIAVSSYPPSAIRHQSTADPN